MKRLMETNIYDVSETMIIVGSCLSSVQSEGYKKLEAISNNIYTLCLEETHINMAITKISAMLRTKKIKKLIFASVDKSPHCVQLHYIEHELSKMMDLSNVEILDYVVVNNELIKVSKEAVALSKNLSKLEESL